MLGAGILALRLDDVVWLGHLNLMPWAFPVMLGGSLLWMGVGFLTRDKAVIAQWGFFTLLNITGIVRWFGN